MDIYDISSDTWKSVVPSPDPTYGHPAPRSVHGFASFRSNKHTEAVALLFHGEKDASAVGHAGAGTFWDDAWMLSFNPIHGRFSWTMLNVESTKPEARGWFAYASSGEYEETTSVIMHGGLLSNNERADDMWLLRIN